MAYAALVLAAVIWGLTFPLMKFAIARFEPQHVAVYRVVFACLGGIVLLPTVVWGRWRWPARSDLGFLILLGILVGWGQGVAFTYGLAWTPVTTAALIIPLNPIFTALLASWWLEERVTTLQWLGVGLAAMGMVVLVLRRGGGVEGGHVAGPLIMGFGAAVLGGLHRGEQAPAPALPSSCAHDLYHRPRRAQRAAHRSAGHAGPPDRLHVD